MTTKYKISEQIVRLISGNEIISGRVKLNEIKLLIEQAANLFLKTEYLTVHLPDGEVIPPNCMIYSYDNVPVTTYKTTSKATLPSIPINLPKGMGVWHVSKTDSIDEPFIPVPSGLWGIVKPQALLGDLSGLIGYEVFGKDIVFTKNLPGLGVNSVFVRLVGVDISTVSDYDMIPISADMEAKIVDYVYKQLVQLPPADKNSND